MAARGSANMKMKGCRLGNTQINLCFLLACTNFVVAICVDEKELTI